jgi:hypothetical protein
MSQYGVKEILMPYGVSLNSVKVVVLCEVSMEEIIHSRISKCVKKPNLHGPRHASRQEEVNSSHSYKIL